MATDIHTARTPAIGGQEVRKRVAAEWPTCDAGDVTTIRTVVLVGLFSAKVRDYQAQIDALEARITALGVHVQGRFIQRRGVSDGGVRLLTSPLSPRFLIGPGKLEQVAAACLAEDIDAVVFLNDLTPHQRRSLSARLGRPVLTQIDIGDGRP
jgi:50S ribosomal subunit-associated GTPase HflX